MKRQWVVKVSGALFVLSVLLLVVSPMVIHRYYENGVLQLWSARYTKAAARLDAARTDGQRFYPLTELAMGAFYLGLTNEARGYAQRLLAMAPRFQHTWNYGNAIHDGNAVLGRIAVRQGRLDDARRYLIEAGKTPGSPQLNSFGPDMGLAQDLLKRGERATVIEYLNLCRRFWEMQRNLLDGWAQAIKAGKTPDLEDKYQ